MAPGGSRKAAALNHMQALDAGGEGDHYPWKVANHQALDWDKASRAVLEPNEAFCPAAMGG